MNFKEYEVTRIHSIEKLDEIENILLEYRDKFNKISFDTIYNPESFQRYRDELNKNLKIAVFAEISNGKSTFLNALIFKDEVLHSDIGEITFGLFKISYSKEIEYLKDGEKINKIDSLEGVISQIERDNELAKSNDKFFRADIKLNDERLSGIEIIDTPGFGSIREEKLVDILIEATRDADGVIFIFDISKGAKAEELKKQKKYIDVIKKDKLWIILNKLDAIKKRRRDSQEQFQKSILNVSFETLEKISNEEIRNKTSENLRSHKVYPLSAKEAVDAKIENNLELLQKSKFDEFDTDFFSELPKFRVQALSDTLIKIDEDFSNALKNIDIKLKSNIDLIKDKRKEIKYLQNVQKQNINALNTLEYEFSVLKPTLKESEKRLIYLYYHIRNSNESIEIIENIKDELIKNISTSLNNFELWDTIQFEGKARELIQSAIKDSENLIESNIENYIYIKIDDLFSSIKNYNRALERFNRESNFDLKEINVNEFGKNDVDRAKNSTLQGVTHKYISIVEDILNVVDKLFISINPFGKPISQKIKEKVMPEFEARTLKIVKENFYDSISIFNSKISSELWQSSENIKQAHLKIQNRAKYFEEDERDKLVVIDNINIDIENLKLEVENLKELKDKFS